MKLAPDECELITYTLYSCIYFTQNYQKRQLLMLFIDVSPVALPILTAISEKMYVNVLK